jgi:hypothetical protein
MYRIIVMLFSMVLIGEIKTQEKQVGLNDVKRLYLSIGQKLAEIKKIIPQASASKIGSVLDDVDGLYNVTATAAQRDKAILKELETRTLESTVLQKELLVAKQESECLKQLLHEAQLKIVAVSKDVEKEHAQAALLKEQNNQLGQKLQQNEALSHEIAKLDKQVASAAQSTKKFTKNDVLLAAGKAQSTIKNQNLNLTSTSDPSSPR